MSNFSESVVEDATLGWLESLGYAILHGPDIAAGEPAAERSDANYRDVVLEGRLRQALVSLNPDLPAEALEDAYRKLTRTDAPSLLERNRAVHRMLVDGVTVEYRCKDLPAPSSFSKIVRQAGVSRTYHYSKQAGKVNGTGGLQQHKEAAGIGPAKRFIGGKKDFR